MPLLSSAGKAASSPAAKLFLARLSWPAEHQDHGDDVHQEGKMLHSRALIFDRPVNAWSPSHFPPLKSLGLVRDQLAASEIRKMDLKPSGISSTGAKCC